MKKLVAILALLLAVPAYANTEIKVKTSERHVIIKTDCFYSITQETKVAMRPLDRKLRVNSKVKVWLDGEPMVCKVKELKPVQKS
jgi:hypothetical protein